MLDEIPQFLSNTRRKFLLKHLVEKGGESSLDEAISYICVSEGDRELRNRKSVYISLKQTHIPKLEKARIIVFDKRRNMIKLEEKCMKDVKMYLELVEGSDIPWSKYYLILSIMTGIFSLYIFDLWGVLISSLFLGSSLINIAKQNSLF
jgi:hypothetical protein